jgi:hypothetical protein
MEKIKKNSPLMLELVLKLYALTCTWQGEVKYHIKQAKQNSNNMKRASMATQEEQQRLGYQVFEVRKE